MNQTKKIKLLPLCILDVPIQKYVKDFTFIVNGEKFKTSQIISDLISPKISQIHSADPTTDVFVINTDTRGDFSKILQLAKFEELSLSNEEIPFFLEVTHKLCTKNLDFVELKNQEITIDNVFNLILTHQQNTSIFNVNLIKETEFISVHFYEICEKKIDDFLNIDIDLIANIISNDKLQLNTEDQLLKFVNTLYKTDSKYSILYDHISFTNVSSEAMKEFI